MSRPNPADTFSFLLTTDNHLGYEERDPRRGDDSFIAFEECLNHGRAASCDAVLLGGDLFHENKPSLSTLSRSIGLIRKYTMGARDMTWGMVSDPAVAFPTHPLPCANFQDPNMNVAMPVFMIHGNHDDPIGGTSAIDVLAAAGMVNYFGRVDNLAEIVLRPILLRKGRTKIALYGMGNIRDERLHRAFAQKQVKILRPPEDEKDAPPGSAVEPWFSILVVHQNRGVRAAFSKNGISENVFRGFGLDLVIWGNEHEQLMLPTTMEGLQFDVVQPGSTILTALNGGECNPKQCGILQICRGQYCVLPHTLRAIRPAVRRQVELAREGVPKSVDAVDEFLGTVVENMLEEATAQVQRIPDEVLRRFPNLKFPLMRLAVDFSDATGGIAFPQPNLNRFGQRYIDVVANPENLLKAVKPPPAARLVAAAAAGAARDAATEALVHFAEAAAISPAARAAAGVRTDDIRTKIMQVLQSSAKDACQLCSEAELSHAVHGFVEKGETHAIGESLKQIVHRCQESIWKEVRERRVEEVTPALLAELALRNKAAVNKHFVEQTTALGGESLGTAESAAAAVPPSPAQLLEEMQRRIQRRALEAASAPAVRQRIDDDDDAAPVSDAPPAVVRKRTRAQADAAAPAAAPTRKTRAPAGRALPALPQLAFAAGDAAPPAAVVPPVAAPAPPPPPPPGPAPARTSAQATARIPMSRVQGVAAKWRDAEVVDDDD